MLKTFICLANSRKEGGRCVAGITLHDLCWFRPVSSKEHGELELNDYTLDDGTEASILDIIRVDVLESVPEPHQPENWLFNEDYQWELIERVLPERAYLFLQSLITTDQYIFGDSSDSISCSKIEEEHLVSSLCLIEPSDITWEIKKSRYGRRQTRAHFTYNDVEYNLSVTDPKWEELLGNLDYGTYLHNELLFGDEKRPGSEDTILYTTSLGLYEKMHKCYKFVAGVIVLPKVEDSELPF